MKELKIHGSQISWIANKRHICGLLHFWIINFQNKEIVLFIGDVPISLP